MSSRQGAITNMDIYSCSQSDDPYTLWSLLESSCTRIAQLDLQLNLVGANAGLSRDLRARAEVVLAEIAQPWPEAVSC